MKEYEVRVVQTMTVYVEASDEEEAIMLAETEAMRAVPDATECEILSSEDVDQEPLTICGEHGCDGCIFQHAHNIEACKGMLRSAGGKELYVGSDLL